nr:MAG TPA: hypothetical protein [Caudoviricetes sp.]
MLSKSSPKKKFIPILRMTAAILFLPVPVTASTILFTEINFLFAVVRLSSLEFPKVMQGTYTNSPLSSLKTKTFFPGMTGSSPPLNFTLVSFLRPRFPCPSMIYFKVVLNSCRLILTNFSLAIRSQSALGMICSLDMVAWVNK